MSQLTIAQDFATCWLSPARPWTPQSHAHGRISIATIVLAAALERFVEIIGEAANGVSSSRQDSLPDVPWRQIIAMRNRLIHGYIAVDYDVLWDIVRDDLPKLIRTLEQAIGEPS